MTVLDPNAANFVLRGATQSGIPAPNPGAALPPPGIATEAAGSEAAPSLRAQAGNLFQKAKLYGTQAVKKVAGMAESAAGRAGIGSGAAAELPPVQAGYARDASGMITRSGAAAGGGLLRGAAAVASRAALPTTLAYLGGTAIANYLDSEGQSQLDRAQAANEIPGQPTRPGTGRVVPPAAQPAPQPSAPPAQQLSTPPQIYHPPGTPLGDEVANLRPGGYQPPAQGGGIMYKSDGTGGVTTFSGAPSPFNSSNGVLRSSLPRQPQTYNQGPQSALDGVDPNDLAGFRGLYKGLGQVANNASQIQNRNIGVKQGMEASKIGETQRSNVANENLKAYDIHSRNDLARAQLGMSQFKYANELATANSDHIRKNVLENYGITDVSKATPEQLATAKTDERRVTNTIARIASDAGIKNFSLANVPREAMPDLLNLAELASKKDADREGITYTAKRLLLGYNKPSVSMDLRHYEPSSVNANGFTPDTVNSMTGTETVGSYAGGGGYWNNPDIERLSKVDMLRQRQQPKK